MKKVLSMVLALVMILSIGTVGASAAAEDYIWIYASTQHARIGDYVYYPVYYEAPKSYGSFVNYDGSTETNIIFPFDYDPEVLKPVGVTPSELLYGMDFEGDIVEVVENFVWTTPDNFDMTWSYFNAAIKFKGYEGIEDGTILFNVKLEVISEEFYDEKGKPKTIFDSGLYIIGNDIKDWKNCVWEATDNSGNVSDFSSLVEYNYRSSFAGFVLEGYEPFIPPFEDDNVENGIYDRITISADVYHARKGDYAYFPVYYDCETAYSEIADRDANSNTKIILPFFYNSNLLKPVEAIPSEQLYNCGGTTEIIKTDEFTYKTSVFPYIYVEVNFNGCIDIENDVFFNVKFEVISDDFFDEYGRLNNDGLFDEFYIVDGNDISKFQFASWQIEKSNGSVKDLSAYVEPGSMSEFYGTTYEELLLKDYEPFIPPVEEDVPPSQFDDISVDADVFHARIGDYAYFPLAYDCDTAYKYYVGSDENSKTKIIFPFLYMPDLLEPVEAIPSEALYNMGGTVKITEFGSYVQSNGSAIDYFLVEVNFDGYEGIIDETILFNIKCKVLSEEFFDEYETYKIGIFDNFHMLENGSVNFSKSCNWEITMSDGTKKDISSRMQPPMLLFYDEYDSYDDFVLTDYEPFIPPVCDITEVTYIQQEDTHKDFTVTANGRKQMIQFVEPDGGTRTYDRYNKNVKITSYNADGEVVSSMARDLAYEVWEIYSNMSVGNEIKVRGKVSGKWDAEKYSFTIEPYNPIISMELSSTSGKKGPVPATVVADEKTEKVMFKMPDNTTVTVASKATDENGNRVFTGKAWMNEDGYNEIRILIYRNNVWRQVGTLEYTVG